MKRQMQQVKIETTNDGTIEIIQEAFGSDDSVVYLAPEQVDTVVAWLREAKNELAGDRSLGDEAIEFLSRFPKGLLSTDHPDYELYQELVARIG